jgi:TonB family protein
MPTAAVTDVYSTREVALAAGVSEHQVVAMLGGSARFLTHAEAVHVGTSLVLAHRNPGAPALFAVYSEAEHDLGSRPVFALTSTVHATLFTVLALIATLNLAPHAVTLAREIPHNDLLRLVFLATPGPGGGGGGGGLREPAPPPKAMREGRQHISSPVPAVKPIAPKPTPVPPPIASEPLPTLIAPIVSSPAEHQNRAGVLEQTTAQTEAHGPGVGGGAGTGSGTGLGSGTGPGIGPGSGGGTGGGPYRPGSGIEPPRILREVKADYTEEARRRGLSGEVVLEIVVRTDGSVGDVKLLHGLGSGLDERAIQAVRQWRWVPSQKQGTPVDVLVEVAVEFKLR